MTKAEAIKVMGTDRFTEVKNPTDREMAMATLAYWESRQSVINAYETSPAWKIGKAILENIPGVTSNCDD